jgi:hypothetical protein
METTVKNHWIATAAIVTAALVSLAFAQVLNVRTTAPEGWFIAGSAPQSYQSTVHSDPSAPSKSYLQLKSRPDMKFSGNELDRMMPFGTMMQSIRANEYRGKSLRFSANVRVTDVENWSGLWVRVDGSGGTLAFDNMQDRAAKGTSAWKRYEVVLPVDESAVSLHFGVLLTGKGEVAISDVEFVQAPKDTPRTGPFGYGASLEKPTNLDFKK